MNKEFSLTEISQELQNESHRFDLMVKRIKDSGGLFYQYRACNSYGSMVHDISNIIQGGVFMRSPLLMNDPYDSMIGFSNEQIYGECIDIILDYVKVTEPLKSLWAIILKYKFLNGISELINQLNNIRNAYIIQRKVMRMTNKDLKHFIDDNIKLIYKKYKSQYSEGQFVVLSALVKLMDNLDLNQDNLLKVTNLSDQIQLLESSIEKAKSIYLEKFSEFLAKTNISCFSASGWNNQLMWSHYANSYSGICIEHDLNNIDEEIYKGFFYPIIYSEKRPTVSLKKLGINEENIKGKKFEMTTAQTAEFFSYLLVKNKPWDYEKEWRFIRVNDSGKEYDSELVLFPFIKSLTFGPKINKIQKDLLIDVCKEKNIECYDLILSDDDFSMTRKRIDLDDYQLDMDEGKYITYLSNKAVDLYDNINKKCKGYTDNADNGCCDIKLLLSILEDVYEVICITFFLKKASYFYASKGITYEEETLKDFKLIDEQVGIMNSTDFYESVNALYLSGFISNRQWPDINVKLKNIKEIMQKYFDVKWMPSDN